MTFYNYLVVLLKGTTYDFLIANGANVLAALLNFIANKFPARKGREIGRGAEYTTIQDSPI